MLKQVISSARAPENRDFRGAYYFAEDSLTLFKELQRVGWELRGRWTVEGIATEKTDTSTKFSTPSLSVCRDLGAMIYTRSGSRATAPRAASVLPGDPPATATLFESRSHHYLRFAANPEAGSQEITVSHTSGADSICEFGLRPNTPSVGWAEPNPGHIYSLIDAIPISIAFSDDSGKLQPEMFIATATIFKSADLAGKGAFTYPVPLTAVTQTNNGKKWAYSSRWDIGQAIRAAGGNVRDFAGEWTVEAEIRTVCEPDNFPKHPLGKARRTLIRRQFRVDGYPKIRFAAGNRTISNVGKEAGTGSVTLELDTTHAPDGEILLPTKMPVTADCQWAGEAKNLPQLPALVFTGRNGIGQSSLPLDFTGFDWSAIPATGRRLELRAVSNLPTGMDERKTSLASVAIELEKRPYVLNLSSPNLIFDLSGVPTTEMPLSGSDSLTAKLSTSLTDATRIETTTKLDTVEFTRLAGGEAGEKSIKLACELKPILVRGLVERPDEARKELSVTVRGLDAKRLPSGRYQAKVVLTHAKDANTQITPATITLTVLVDQMRIRFAGVRDDRLESVALAGTTTVWPVDLKLALEGKGATIRKASGDVMDFPRAGGDSVLPPVRLTGVRQALKLAVLGGSAELIPSTTIDTRYYLAMDVPLSIHDGEYRFPLEFHLQATNERKETKTYLTQSDSVVVVKRHGLTADAIPPIEVTGDQPATAKVHIVPAVSSTLRWTARVLDEPSALPASAKPWHDCLELTEAERSPGQCVLLRGNATVGKRATEPFVTGQPKDFTLKVNPAGLKPGRYRCRIRLTPTVVPVQDLKPGEPSPEVSDAGIPFDIPVEVIVRGLIPELVLVPEKLELIAVIQASKTEPGAWSIGSKDFPGWKPSLTLTKSLVDDVISRYSATLPVPVGRGGSCTFEFKPVDNPMAAGATVAATLPGRLEVDRTLCADGETVTVRLKLTAAAGLPPDVVVSRRGGDANSPFARVKLLDDGKGADHAAGDLEYTGQFTFPPEASAQFGEYDIRIDPAAKLTYPVAPTRCLLGIVRKAGERTDTLEYSKGVFEAIYGPDFVNAPEFVSLKITGVTNPKYRVQVKYLVSAADATSEQFLKSKPGPTTEAFDPSIHLKASATGPAGAEGVLSKEIPQWFGVSAELSDGARSAIEAGNPHPTLDSRCGLVLVLTVTGSDSEGNPVSWEGTFPYVVKTKSFMLRTGLVWLVVAMITIPLGVLIFLRWRRRHRLQQARTGVSGEAIPGDPLLDAPMTKRPPATDAKSPPPPPPPPRRGSKPPGEDLF